MTTTRVYRMAQKGIAALLSLSLLWTSVNAADILTLPSVLQNPILPAQFRLIPPTQLGRVSDYFDAPGSRLQAPGLSEAPLVILIQDLHAHYGVQKNIAGLLEFLSSRLQAVGSKKS